MALTDEQDLENAINKMSARRDKATARQVEVTEKLQETLYEMLDEKPLKTNEVLLILDAIKSSIETTQHIRDAAYPGLKDY